MKIKIFIKYLALLSAIALAPLWFLGYSLISIGQTSVKTALMELQLANAKAAAEVFDNSAADLAEKTRLLRDRLSTRDWRGKVQFFNTFIEMNPEITAASVVSLSGQELVKALSSGEATGAEKLRSYSGSGDFARARAERRSPSLYLSADSEKLVCYCFFGDKFLLRTETPLDKPLAALDLKQAGFGGYIVLADSQGRPLIPPGLREGPKRVLAAEALGWPVFKAALRNRMGSGSMEFSDSGRTMLGAYVPFRNAEGAAIIVQPLETAYGSVLFMKRQAVFSIVGVMAVVLAALVLVSWRLAGRLSGELPAVESNFLKRVWPSLKSTFRDDSNFPWGRISLGLFTFFIGCVVCAYLLARSSWETSIFLIGLTTFFASPPCLLLWADKALARRDIRRAFMLPLRITLEFLAGAAGLGLVVWLVLMICILCGMRL